MCSCLFRKLRSGGSARFSGAAALNVYISKTMKPRERLQKSIFCLFFPLFNIYDCYHYENENKHNYSFSHFQPLCLLLIPCYKTNRKKYTNAHIFNANQLIKSLKKQNMRIMSVTAQTPVKIVYIKTHQIMWLLQQSVSCTQVKCMKAEHTRGCITCKLLKKYIKYLPSNMNCFVLV